MTKNLKKSEVVFFTLKDKKYIDENGTEIPKEVLLNHSHYISEDISLLIVEKQ